MQEIQQEHCRCMPYPHTAYLLLLVLLPIKHNLVHKAVLGAREKIKDPVRGQGVPCVCCLFGGQSNQPWPMEWQALNDSPCLNHRIGAAGWEVLFHRRPQQLLGKNNDNVVVRMVKKKREAISHHEKLLEVPWIFSLERKML